LNNTKFDLDDYKKENSLLSSKLQAYGEDKNHFIEKSQQLEMQLVTSYEKNKACQLEVSQRDQNLIKLQSDLNLMQEKYSSSLEEVKIQQDEIERLNMRIKSQSSDLKDIQSINDHMEEKLNNSTQLNKQREYEIEIYKQDLSKQDKQIENIKAEWTANIRNHEEEIKGYKQNFQILNEELAHTKSDLSEFMSKISTLKMQVSELSVGLESKTEENERLIHGLKKYETICKEQEAKICQYSSELSMSGNQNENLSFQIENLCSKLEQTESKHQQALKSNDKLEMSLKKLQESLIELKFKVNIFNY
jgi:chromosome segregation ATPase